MRLIAVSACAFFILPASAGVNDHFQCKLNLKRGPQTQAFQLKQLITAERKSIAYPAPNGRTIFVTEANIPYEIYLGWDKLTAKITYRHALERDAQGKALRAAQWKCFEASIETIDGLDSFSCGDQQRTDDPFADPNQRWRPVAIKNDSPDWNEGQAYREQFISGDDNLTLDCVVQNPKML
ncbi:hypothetical protein EBR21_04405 [bacterium]|nr:hypothetical protein [bacterium]